MNPILRALKHKNYRLFFFGQSLSLIGTWLSRVAMSWLVYRLTGSALILGIVSFASQIPIVFFVPIAGVYADRHDQQKLLILTQVLFLFQTLLLGILVLTHTIQIWHIIVISIFQGVVNSFDIPTRQSFLIRMVDHSSDLSNAIALNSSMFNSARMIGPAIAGILIARFGEGVCFLIDAGSYLFVIVSLFMMKLAPKTVPKKVVSVMDELKEGLHYVRRSLPMRYLLSLVAWLSLMAMSYLVLLPIFAKQIFHGGPTTLGILTSASGLGALTGALYLASRKSIIGLRRLIYRATLLSGISLLGFAWAQNFYVALFFIYLTAFGLMVQLASSNTVLQTIVDDDKRGRVMSFYTLAFLGMSPLGGLLAGTVAHYASAPDAIFLGGISCLIATMIYAQRMPALKEQLRPIYIRKGIIPAGIQTVTQLSNPKD